MPLNRIMLGFYQLLVRGWGGSSDGTWVVSSLPVGNGVQLQET